MLKVAGQMVVTFTMREEMRLLGSAGNMEGLPKAEFEVPVNIQVKFHQINEKVRYTDLGLWLSAKYFRG